MTDIEGRKRRNNKVNRMLIEAMNKVSKLSAYLTKLDDRRRFKVNEAWMILDDVPEDSK